MAPNQMRLIGRRGQLSAEGQLAIDRMTVRKLAQFIRTPEHFEALLQQTDPDLRDGVRDLLIPLLPFAYTCTEGEQRVYLDVGRGVAHLDDTCRGYQAATIQATADLPPAGLVDGFVWCDHCGRWNAPGSIGG